MFESQTEMFNVTAEFEVTQRTFGYIRSLCEFQYHCQLVPFQHSEVGFL